EIDGLRQVVVQLDGHLLQVEDDVRGILDHAGDRRELVQYAFDFHGRDGRTLDRAEQRAAQRIAYRGAPTALKRLGRKTAVPFGQRFELRRETLRFLKSLPHRVPSFRPGGAGPNFLRSGQPLDWSRKEPVSRPATTKPLLRVQLDDELLVDRRRLHVFALGQGHDLGPELFAVLLEPRHGVLALRHVARLQNHGVLVHLVLDGHFLAHVHLVGRNVDLLPVDAHVAVEHELPRLRPRGRQAGPPHDVVQTPLQHNDQDFARGTFDAHRFFEIVAELALQEPVGALYLLFFAELQTVARNLRAP